MNEELIKNYRTIIESLPSNVDLVAVSKMHSAEKIEIIYHLGQRIFGENKVQELVEKYEILPKNIEWHLIGHLQTNKVKYVAPFINTIQSVDSKKVLKEINKEAEKNQRVINVLLQVKIAVEDSKFGLTIEEAKQLYNDFLNKKFPHIMVKGLMGMATFTDNEVQIKSEFLRLKTLFDDLGMDNKSHTLSMGMSGDYELAIECGANSVRIGSAIFGTRN